MQYYIQGIVLFAVMSALAEGVNYLKHEWTGAAFVAFCLIGVCVIYWIARTMDAHDAK